MKHLFKKFASKRIEFPLLLANYGMVLSGSVMVNFVIYRSCMATFGYNETECAKLGSNRQDNSSKEIEEHVEPYANYLNLVMQLSSQILPSLACLFIGHWSDKNGRKPILVAAMLGHICTSLIKFVVSVFPMASPWLLVTQAIPTILSGGIVTFHMVCLCYITETSEEEDRSFRMGVLEVTSAVAIVSGMTSSSYIFEAVGYSGLFAISTLFEVTSFFYVFFFIEESLKNKDATKVREVVSFKIITVMIKTVTRARKAYERKILLLLMASLALYSVARSENHIFYPFLRLTFGWDLRKFTWLITTFFLLHTTGTFFGLGVMQKMCRIPDGAMLLLSYGSALSGGMTVLLATEDWHFFLAAAIQFETGVIGPIVRSIISTIVDSGEVGKVFSLTMAVEAICHLVAATMYTMIYNNTLVTFPAAFMLPALTLYSTELVIISVLIVFMKRRKIAARQLEREEEEKRKQNVPTIAIYDPKQSAEAVRLSEHKMK